jgi:hypothetical protein
MESPLRRSKRIALIIVGALIIFLSTGPPDFAAGLLFTAGTSDLDGGAHKLHLLLRGASTMVMVLTGLVLIIKPSWSVGVLQKLIASGIAFPIAGLISMHLWPPVVIYPIIAILAGAVILWVFRGRLPWQQQTSVLAGASRPMLALAAVMSIPLLVFGLNQAALQRTTETLHGDLGHWAGGMAMALMIIIMMFFGALKMPGWRVPAWSAGFTLLVLGIASVYWPGQASSVGEGWGTLAIIGAVAFVGMAELEGRLFTRTTPQPA